MPTSPPTTRAWTTASAPRGSAPHRARKANRGVRPSAPTSPAAAAWPELRRLPRLSAEASAYVAVLLGSALISLVLLWPALAHLAAAGGLPILLEAAL